MPDRLTRDAYGLKLAEAAALRADCTRRQVGAVIVAEDGSIVATGYNGLSAGRPGCLSAGACPRGQMTYDDQPADVDYEAAGCRAVHAEVNAVIRAGRDRCVGATIYVTAEPCFHCSVVIEGAGISRVVTPGDIIPRGTVTTADIVVGPVKAFVYGVRSESPSSLESPSFPAIPVRRGRVLVPGDEAWLIPATRKD